MAKQTFTTGQVLTAAQQNSLQANDFNQTVSVKTANYSLLAADKGTRIEFNTSGSVTCTVNSGQFDAGDTLIIQNRGAGTATITAGTATVNTSASLALAQYSAGTLYFVSDSAALFFGDAAGISASIVDAKGDLIVGTADNTVARLAVGTNGHTLVADSSVSPTGLKWAAPASAAFVGVAASGSSGKTNSDATFTSVDFDTEAFDTDGIHSTTSNTSRFTVPSGKGGKWLFLSIITWQAGTYTEIISRWYKNGVQQLDRAVGRPAGSAGNIFPAIFDLAAGDYMEVFSFQSSGGNKNTESPFMYVAYLGA
jgi:hypothetical protein